MPPKTDSIQPRPTAPVDYVTCVGLQAGHVPGHAILRGIDLALSPGMALWIVGSSGVGKSLLLSCLMGHMAAESGDVRLFGAPIATQAQRLAARARIGFVAQHPIMSDQESVQANIALAARTGLGSANVAPTDIEALIRYFGLEAHAQAPARALAPGRRRLAALACATVRKPDLLLIDTPFADLDRGEAQRVAHMLAQLQGLGAALILAATQTDPYELRHWPAMRLDRGRLHLNPARDGP